MPLACLFAPYPPAPLPRRGRGSPRLFHARGFAPCIPGVEPGRHRSRGRIARWRRGLPCLACSPRRCCLRRGACLLCRLPTLPLACFPAPYPPTPFPGGEGGDQGYFMQGAKPLASPGLNPNGTGTGGRTTHPAGELSPCLACATCRSHPWRGRGREVRQRRG